MHNCRKELFRNTFRQIIKKKSNAVCRTLKSWFRYKFGTFEDLLVLFYFFVN